MKNDVSWQAHMQFPFMSVRDVFGNKLSDAWIMRRRINGQWQYRAMTDAEEKARQCDDAW